MEEVPNRTIAQRAGRMLPFLAVIVGTFPLALVGQQPGERSGLVLVAAAIFAAVALLVLVLPWWRMPESSRLIVVVGFCAGVFALRESGGGGNAGYASLLLLPVVWQAVYGRWRDTIATIAATTATIVLPIVIIGGERYPGSEWRKAALTTMVFTSTGLVVNRLMERLRQQERMVDSVLAVSRRLDGTNVREEIVEAVLAATGADCVVLSELDGARRSRVTAAVGTDLPSIPFPVEQLPGYAQEAIAWREPVFVADLLGDDRMIPALQRHTGMRSNLQQPIVRGGEVLGLISVAWRRPHRRPPAEVMQIVAMLAAEAAIAIDRASLISQLDQQARRDQLTGVLNRRAWDEHIARELARSSRSGAPAAIALLDLDHFKAFNDAHGHLAGDELLREAAAAWGRELRAADVLARWGGEEFVVLLPDTDLATAEAVVARLRDATPSGQGFSAGVVAVTGTDARALLRAADAALYAAKAAGRGCTVLAGVDGPLPHLLAP